jgi:hypothetical protein
LNQLNHNTRACDTKSITFDCSIFHFSVISSVEQISIRRTVLSQLPGLLRPME